MGEATRSERLAAARQIATHTKEEWTALVAAIGGICVKCRVPAAELVGGSLCKDHIKPIYQGGSDGLENLQPLCRECNAAKGAEAIDHRENASPGWRERLAKRLANASQTPAPALVASPSPSPSSDPNGSGGAEPKPEGKPKDPNGEAWDRGVAVLVDRGRLKEADARKFLGKLFRDHKLEGRDLLPSIVNCELNGTLEPQAYLTRAARAVAERKGAAAPPSPEDRVAAWGDDEWRHALDLFRTAGTWGEAWGPRPGQSGCRVPASLLETATMEGTA